MKAKFSALVEVRKLTALAIVLLFITLALKGTLEVNFIQTVIISVVSFYFGKSTALDKSNGGDA
jgi:thiamine transporter ThiT